jgi:hypothetical protein
MRAGTSFRKQAARSARVGNDRHPATAAGVSFWKQLDRWPPAGRARQAAILAGTPVPGGRELVLKQAPRS